MNENGMQLLMVNNLMRYANAVIDWYDEMEFNGPLLTDLYYKEFLTFEWGREMCVSLPLSMNFWVFRKNCKIVNWFLLAGAFRSLIWNDLEMFFCNRC